MRTKRLSALMPSVAQTDSVGRSSIRRSRTASRKPAGQRFDARKRLRETLALFGDVVGPGLRTFDGGAGLVEGVVDRGVARLAPHRVDDLVLEHGRQPGAQRGASAEGGASGEHRLEDVVDRVLGQDGIAEASSGEAHEIGAVRDQLGP